MKTIYYINTLRTIATLAVVFLHTGAGIFETRHFPIHDITYDTYNYSTNEILCSSICTN